MSELPFRAVIFDLDGTLADSLADIALAMNASLESAGLPTHPLDAYRRMVGEGVENLARRAAPADSAVPVETLVGGFRRAYDELDHRNATLYPGIEELLAALTARGVPLAVLSNKRDDFTRALVKRRLGQFPFVDVRGEREGVPRKPDPTAAFELSLVLGVSPKRIAFVGDTAIDMKTANAAGMTAVGVLWGFRGRDELVRAGAHHLIASPLELLSLGAKGGL